MKTDSADSECFNFKMTYKHKLATFKFAKTNSYLGRGRDEGEEEVGERRYKMTLNRSRWLVPGDLVQIFISTWKQHMYNKWQLDMD